MTKRPLLRGLAIIGAFFVSQIGAPGTAISQTLQDLDVIKSRFLAPLYIDPPSRNTVAELSGSMRADGSFPTVDYADTNGGNWKTYGHLSQVLTLARAYSSPESDMRGDEHLKGTVLHALDFWLARDFKNSNWWWNQIGVPGRLSECLLLLDGDLSEEQLRKGIAILERSKIGMTGANLVDVAFITVKRGILEKKPDVVAEAVKSITGEIRITMEEGVQPDFSFHQHGALLYNHGYGAVFMSNCSELAVIVEGTGFAFPKEKIDILNGLILDGTRWMIRYSTKDYGATGRGITRRSGNSPSAGYLREVAESMLKLPTGREKDYRDFLKYLDGKNEMPFSGNRHFYRGDIMTHHRPGWYASARMFSNRLLNTDRPHNGEGLKSHHLADGCTYIMQSGMEYHDIFPLWDWQKIPGATIEQKPELTGDICRQGTRPFAGGVSDGMYGAAAFDFERDGLTARKSWFYFDSEFVCLGSGIGCSSGNLVVTTVNQCFLRGDVSISGNGQLQTLEHGGHKLDGVRFVYHDGIAYIFPGNQPVRLENDVRTGAWLDISTQYSPNDTVTDDVFTLQIDHGTKPDKAKYAYIVSPGLPAGSVAGYAQSPSVEILSNTPALQAVRHRDLSITGAAFYRPGRLAFGKTVVEVDKPCLLLLRESGNSTAVTVSNPVNTEMTVLVSMSLAGKKPVHIRFDLPGGMEGGRSVTKSIKTAQ